MSAPGEPWEWVAEAPPGVPLERKLELTRAAVARDPSSALLREQFDHLLQARAPAMLFQAAKASLQAGCREEAIDHLTRALEVAPGHFDALHLLVRLLGEQGDLTTARHVCERCLQHAPGNTPALALLAQVCAITGDTDRAASLLDLDHLVSRRVLQWPELPEDVNRTLADAVLRNPGMMFEPQRRTARQGYRGPLSPSSSDVAGLLFTRLRHEATTYRATLDASHAFAASAPARATLSMWSVLLGQGGHVVPHIHPGAWMSGVYYVAVPGGAGDGGMLELGCKGPTLDGPYPETLVRRIRPEPGLLVLFPSYVYHRTIPTTSRESRICVAFDVVEAR